jgi:hypothetical protein
VTYRRNSLSGGEAFAAFLAIVLIIVIVLVISTLIIFFGWNLGVVALVAACGGSVSKIGFWTAFFVGLAISVIRGLFKAA